MFKTYPRLKILSLIFLIFVGWAGSIYWQATQKKRSPLGRVVRFFKGEAGAHQTVNDLAEDIRTLPALAQLQPWSLETLARFREGTLRTNHGSRWFPCTDIRLAEDERPAFINERWGRTNDWGQGDPEIVIVRSTNGQPECVVIAWYLHGIVVGPPDYQFAFNVWYYAKAKPGIYAYHVEK